MSIISICVEIGRELRKTKIGKQALADYEVIKAAQNSEKNYLYLESISKHRTKYHFFSPDAALKLIEANIDNERVGSDCRLIAQDEAVQRFAKSMIQLGGVVRNFPEFAMSPQVRYSMPPAIDVTPQTIRLINQLAVEYQRTQLPKQLIELQASKKELLNRLLVDIGEYEKRNPDASFGIIGEYKFIEEMIEKGHDESIVMTLSKILSAVLYMQLAVFDAFLDEIMSVRMDSDVIIDSTDFRHGYQHKTITCTASQVLSFVRGGWLLELKNESDKREFYQVKEKTVHFASREKPDTKVTMNAVELNWL